MKQLRMILLSALVLTALNYLTACAPSSSSNTQDQNAMPSNIVGDWQSFRKTCMTQSSENPVQTSEISEALAEYYSISKNSYELYKLESNNFFKIEDGTLEDLKNKYISYDFSGDYLVAKFKDSQGSSCNTYFKRSN